MSVLSTLRRKVSSVWYLDRTEYTTQWIRKHNKEHDPSVKVHDCPEFWCRLIARRGERSE